MTIEELERDLRVLAEPREDELLRRAIGARLDEQMCPKRRPRLQLGFGLAAVAAAAIAVAIVSLGGPGGSAGPSAADAAIIRHALRAITLPTNAIVHVKETGVQDGTPVVAEWWQQTSPPYALRMIKGPVGRQGEAANDGTTSFEYEAGTNTIVETPAASAPALVDPIASVREQLASGAAQVAGTATINGVSLYKIELPTGVVGYFDTTDYRPMYLDNPQRDGSLVRTRVVTYEELPMTSDTAKLLSITTQHPQARVDTPNGPSRRSSTGSAGSSRSRHGSFRARFPIPR
jgi:hypothetical protein